MEQMASSDDAPGKPASKDPARWARINAIFDAVNEAPTDERERLLRESAGGDEDLVRIVRDLIAASERTDNVFDGNAFSAIGRAADSPVRVKSLIGQTLGAYRVTGEIGRGGMGVVYEAARIDAQFEKRVAIKSLAFGIDRPELQWRFKRERQILAGLSHPNIASLLDGGTTDDGTPYLVMEFISGKPIDEWCNARRLTITQRLEIFRQVCAAVQFAHAKLVVHRDLKPSNILVTEDGTVKLLDFGIAKLILPDGSAAPDVTHDGMAPLTVAYASPEQARGEEATIAADVYSLGMVLYRLLTGAAPYEVDSKSRVEALTILTTHPPRAPSEVVTDEHARVCGRENARRLRTQLSGELDAILLMALRKEPERRYANVAAFSQDLLHYLNGQPVTARPDTLSYRIGKFVRRERALVAGASIAVAALVVGTFMSVSSANIAKEEARRATRTSEYLRAVVGAADPSHYSTFRLGKTDVMLSEVLDSTRSRVGRDLADEPRMRADMYWTLGNAFRAFSRNDVAALLLDSAKMLHAQTLGERSLEVTRDVHYRALVHQETGSTDLAIQGFRDALARYRRHPAPPDSELTDILVSLGQALGVGAQQLEEGASLLREAEQRETSAAKPRWALLGILQGALASTLASGRDVHLADAVYERAVTSFKNDSLATRTELGFTLLNWGTSLSRRGQAERAVELKREALRHLQGVYGPDHYLAAGFRQRLADDLVKTGRLNEAQATIDSAIVVQESLAQTNYLELSLALRVRAAIETRTGRLDIAQRTLQRAHTMLDKLGAVRTVPEVGIMQEFARLYEARGQIPAARSELEQAHALAKEKLGPSSVHTLNVMSRLADFYARTGDSVKATAIRADSAAGR